MSPRTIVYERRATDPADVIRRVRMERRSPEAEHTDPTPQVLSIVEMAWGFRVWRQYGGVTVCESWWRRSYRSAERKFHCLMADAGADGYTAVALTSRVEADHG